MDQQEHEVDHGRIVVFFVLAFAMSWITVLCQTKAGAVAALSVTPLGARGTTKLKKFFIDNKVPKAVRDRNPKRVGIDESEVFAFGDGHVRFLMWRDEPVTAIAFAGWFSTVLAAVGCAGQLAWSGTVGWAGVFTAMAGVHMLVGAGAAGCGAACTTTRARSRPRSWAR